MIKACIFGLVAVFGVTSCAERDRDAVAPDRTGYDERDPAYGSMPGDARAPTPYGQSKRDE